MKSSPRRGPFNRLHAGDWSAGRANAALLLVQLIVLWGAMLRGLDYLQPRAALDDSLTDVERFLPLWVWGIALVVCAAAGLLGLAGRWAAPIIVAHLGLFAIYVGVGVGELQRTGIAVDATAAGGLVVGGIGTWLIFRQDSTSTLIRLLVGVPAMFLGQWLLAEGLGIDYRRGVILIATGLIHLVSSFGTLVLWLRQRARDRVLQERAARDVS